MIFRWLRADALPVPATRVVPFDELDEVCLRDQPPRRAVERRARVTDAAGPTVRRRFRR